MHAHTANTKRPHNTHTHTHTHTRAHTHTHTHTICPYLSPPLHTNSLPSPCVAVPSMMRANAALCLAGLTSLFHQALQPLVLSLLLKTFFLVDRLSNFQRYRTKSAGTMASSLAAWPHFVHALALLGVVPTPVMN